MEKREMQSIEHAETEDEGVDVRGYSQVEEYDALEDGETQEYYIDGIVIKYNQVSKCRNNKD